MDDTHELISRMHQASYHENQPVSAEKQGLPFPQYLDEVSDESSLLFLPEISGFIPQDNNLTDLLAMRRSLRRYDESSEMSMDELSYLLKYSQGVREIDEKRTLTNRFVPSAGSRHPFVTFLLVQRVTDLTPGLYRYIAQRHALEVFDLDFESIRRAHESTYKQKQVITSAVTFFWAANLYRTSWRYSTRAYRYINLDAGHVCQNLYLCAESIDYGVCAIAAFDDRLINRLFGLDEVERFMVYAASVGKKIHQV